MRCAVWRLHAALLLRLRARCAVCLRFAVCAIAVCYGMLLRPSYTKARALTRVCNILNQSTLTPSPWSINAEQAKILQLLCDGEQVLVLKSRQIGVSTVTCYFDLLLATVNDGISIALCCDTEAKSIELLGKCKGFAADLEVGLTRENDTTITLENGSSIKALTAAGGSTAKGSKTGRSGSYQFVHFTELAYYDNERAYGALKASSSGAPIIVESTANGPSNLYARLWSGNNTFRKVFFSVESHSQYRADPSLISDQRWLELRGLGFTSREAAAHWERARLDAGASEIEHLRDFPVLPEQPFLLSESRWSTVQHRVGLVPRSEWGCIISIDVSGAKGRDYTVVCVVDRDTHGVIDYWESSTDDVFSVVSVVRERVERFAPQAIIVETNGVGETWPVVFAREGIALTPHRTTEASRADGLALVRRHLECPTGCAPQAVADEARALVVRSDGKLVGKKDGLMCWSFALLYLQANPLVKPLVNRPQSNYFAEVLAELDGED